MRHPYLHTGKTHIYIEIKIHRYFLKEREEFVNYLNPVHYGVQIPVIQAIQ